MDIKEIKETTTWQLYEKGRNYHRLTGIYTDTDRNHRMYNGNQWEGAKLGDVEPVQKNFIKPIVKFKNGVIHDNHFAIIYSSQNFENRVFRKEAEKICEMLNKKAARIWEKDKLDFKGRKLTKDAAINDEGIMYVDYDMEAQMPVNEIIKKNDVYYGNENDDDIQNQPYILIRKRMPVSNARDYARNKGLSEDKLDLIVGDNDNFEESGEAAKDELDNMVTVITKMWKEKGTVHFSFSTRWVDIKENADSGLTLYPVSHFNWEEKEGSARGEGEVRFLIPNQIEVNRTEMRRVLAVKLQAYPQKVINVDQVVNPSAVNQVGGVIKVSGGLAADDVHKIVTSIPPAQMSPDVKQLQEDLINVTRELAGAGDAATGQVDPENASGRAILAVQQASQSPMTEQKEGYKNFLEDLARIWLDMLIVYSQEGITLEDEITDPQTGESYTELRTVPQTALEELKATVKIDITPKGAFDKYAQEMSIENMFQAGLFNVQRLPELKVYVKLLDDDSVMPKAKLEEAIEIMEAEQRKIAEINAQAQIMQQRANQFLMEDPDAQASQILDAERQLQMEAEQEVALEESELEAV
ncbi:MAG: hypothetical protein J6S45_08375 [Firmicutes bacterium]|nr:hypothetical protein [Bacillota bacterium]